MRVQWGGGRGSRTQLEGLAQRVTKAKSEVQRIEQRRYQFENGYAPLREEVRRRQEEVNKRER